MGQSDAPSSNYWQQLKLAEAALTAGSFQAAEHAFFDASAMRSSSPGRVFLTEKISDGLSRLIRSTRQAGTEQGRWHKRSDSFKTKFLDNGELIVRDAVRQAELRPEDDAEKNQPLLETALFLVTRSRVFEEEPASAVPLLKGLFRTSRRTGRPFDVNLIKHDIPLTEEDRLWLARRGEELLDEYLEQGWLTRDSQNAREWTEVFLQILQPCYFGSTNRLEEERAWLEAVTADRLVGNTNERIERYQAYLVTNSTPGPRPDEARIRLLELFANIDGQNFSVPRYGDALSALQSAGLSVGSNMSQRYESALEAIEYRRPEETANSSDLAWASVAAETDGRLAIVYWWGPEPRDLAFWHPEDSSENLLPFLEPCRGRIIAADENVLAAVENAWPVAPALWTIRDYGAAFLESQLAETGLNHDVLLKTGLGETAAWRKGWRADVGQEFLEPPRGSATSADWQKGSASSAVLAGLVWLAIRTRISQADPSLRAGIGELFRRGDKAAGFLYEFLTLGQGSDFVQDATFEPWTLPLLWTRTDPFGWSNSAINGPGPMPVASSEQSHRPDLSRNDLAIVSTGDPGAALSAWGSSNQKWRVVLDRTQHLDCLTQIAGTVIGPATVIPVNGKVHSLNSALELLESLLADSLQSVGRTDGMLPLFHWLRLVETHNGDLLDFVPRQSPAVENFPLYVRYAELVENVDYEEPSLSENLDRGSWASQFSQRARKSGLVAGHFDQLALTADRLDSIWGVFEGADASWVFLDSAAIHWNLYQQANVDITRLHGLLFSRGCRHLSLLLGATFGRAELEELLGTWLGAYGSPYCLSFTNLRVPFLRLVDHGLTPDARLLAEEMMAGQLSYLNETASEKGVSVRIPSGGYLAEFWAQIDRDGTPAANSEWSFISAGQSISTGSKSGRLVVPALASLNLQEIPIADDDSLVSWQRAELDRQNFLAWRRKLCCLEISGLLAGSWKSVEILDTRWWRVFRPIDTDAGSATSWSAEHAAALVAPTDCRIFDMPQNAGGSKNARSNQQRQNIRKWLRERNLVDEDGRGFLPAGQNFDNVPTHAAVQVPAEGITFCAGSVKNNWLGLITDVAEAWERGVFNHWLLYVAQQIPAEAASVVAAVGTAGISVWPALEGNLNPGPVVWVSPADFADPALADLLTKRRPAAIMTGEIASWLPTLNSENQESALALKLILSCRAKFTVIKTSGLPDPWRQFLAQAAGAPDRYSRTSAEKRSTLESETDSQILSGAPISPVWGDAQSSQTIVARLQRLLPRLGELSDGSTAGGDQLVPVDWLADMAGLENRVVAEGMRNLRWVARFSGETVSDAAAAEVQPGELSGHKVLVFKRFAELENILNQIQENISILLPLWLGEIRTSSKTWIDLAFPPTIITAEELALLDDYLLRFVVPEEQTTLQGIDPIFIYRCPRGKINSTRRVIACNFEPSELITVIEKQLNLFRARTNDLLSSAVETGEGFLIETGLRDLRDSEREFLALGSVLGFWRWAGPACSQAMYLVDLISLADSPAAKSKAAGWQLLSSLFAVQAGYGSEAVSTGRHHKWRDSIGNLFTDTGESQTLKAAVARIAALVTGNNTDGLHRNLLVLRGMAGSGRHSSLLQGLIDAGNQTADLAEITFYCPDTSIAVLIVREATSLGLTGPLDIRITVPGELPTAEPAGLGAEPGTGSPIIVMCEVQRFEPESRYRIAQLGRRGRLIMTVDAQATSEPWENLFLTTPRSTDVFDFPDQLRLAKKLWSEVRLLTVGNAQKSGHSKRRDKGVLVADYSANLDQCLSRIVNEHSLGQLAPRMRLVAPLAADLEYLAGSLRDRGWLAVDAEQLSFLLLPGTLEFLCAVTDLMHQNINRWSDPGPDDPEGTQVSNLDEAVTVGPGVLGTFVDSFTADVWQDWLGAQDLTDAQITINDCYDLILKSNCLSAVLALPDARARLTDLLSSWGEVQISTLPEYPLWEAWWYSILDITEIKETESRRPLVIMASSDYLAGEFESGGIYLCLGTEPQIAHYQVLSRVTDNLLVLYQDRSPLPGQAAD